MQRFHYKKESFHIRKNLFLVSKGKGLNQSIQSMSIQINSNSSKSNMKIIRTLTRNPKQTLKLNQVQEEGILKLSRSKSAIKNKD